MSNRKAPWQEFDRPARKLISVADVRSPGRTNQDAALYNLVGILNNASEATDGRVAESG